MKPNPVAEHHNGLIFLLPALIVIEVGDVEIVGRAEKQKRLLLTMQYVYTVYLLSTSNQTHFSVYPPSLVATQQYHPSSDSSTLGIIS